MINVNNDFKKLTKKIKQQDLKLSIVDGELTVKEIHFMTVKQFNLTPVWMLRARKKVIAKELKYSFEGNLFKTIMKQIEITVKNAGELKDKNVNFQYGIYINNNFEYVDLGDFYIKDIEDNKGKSEMVVTGYDKMINFMKTFKQSDLQLTYPCTMLALIQKMCEVCGVELYSTNFFHADLQVDEDYFTAQELSYRDVLEKVAESTETTIFIKDNKLYLHKLASNPVEKLDASYLTSLTIKEKFGPVNALVLGRGDVEDNIEAKDDISISQNGRCEIRFDENEFVEYQREEVIDEMFEQIKGLEYYAFEGSDVGVMWLEPCDLIEVEDSEENIYKTIYLSANITINTGISSDIEADIPEETTTEYKVTTKEEKKTLKVERLAKKNEGLIQDVIEQQTETGNKLTKVEQDIDGITQTVSSVEEQIDENNQNISQTNQKVTQIEQTVEGVTQTVENVQTNLNENYSTTEQMNSAIEQSAGEINLEVSQKIDNIQVGAANLIPNSAPYNLEKYIISNTDLIELTLQDEETAPSKKCLCIRTLEQLTSTQGIYVYPTSNLKEGLQYCFSIWIRATANTNLTIGVGNYGTTAFNVTTEYQKFNYKFTATDSDIHGFAIYLPINTIAGRQIFVHSIMLEEGNQITSWSPSPDDTATKTEMNSKIEQTAEEINLEVSKKVGEDTVCSVISQSSDEILLKGNRVLIESDNFKLSKNGQVVITDSTAEGTTTDQKANFTIQNKDGNIKTQILPNRVLLSGGSAKAYLLNTSSWGYIGVSSDNDIGKCRMISAGSDLTFIDCSDGNNTSTMTPQEITSPKLTQTSLENIKKNISYYRENALEIILNSEIYSYNLKSEKDTDKKHIGFVIGDKYKTPKDIMNTEENAIELYSAIGILWKAIQEQQELIKKQNNTIKDLENRIEKLEQKVGEVNE